jgi:hypothetical protein
MRIRGFIESYNPNTKLYQWALYEEGLRGQLIPLASGSESTEDRAKDVLCSAASNFKFAQQYKKREIKLD